jgi:hypothetical protein
MQTGRFSLLGRHFEFVSFVGWQCLEIIRRRESRRKNGLLQETQIYFVTPKNLTRGHSDDGSQ